MSEEWKMPTREELEKDFVGKWLLVVEVDRDFAYCFEIRKVEDGSRCGATLSDGKENGHEVYFLWSELELFKNATTISKVDGQGNSFEYSILVKPVAQEKSHDDLCREVMFEYIVGFINGKRFYFQVQAISDLRKDGVEVSDGVPDGWRLFITWDGLRRMFALESIDIKCDTYDVVECRFVRSYEDIAEIEKQWNKEDGQEPLCVELAEQATRDFLEDNDIIPDRTDGRKASDIVRECREAIGNAFSDMVWDLSEHPVRPSVVIEAHEEKGRLMTVLQRFEAVYKEMEAHNDIQPKQ